MIKYPVVGLFCFMTVMIACAQHEAEFFLQADTFFTTYVSEGKVDYKSIVKNPSSLNELLDHAGKINLSKDNTANYQAFWINGYNLLVIKSIVDNYPIKSPLDKSGFFDIKKHEIGGELLTLNDIEHKMLRALFPNEPRFHFVLVCAGLGCPPIINKAYMPNTLDAQLEQQTKLALNDPLFIQVNKNKVKISQIFEWYKSDFTKEGENLIDFINKYRTEKLPENAKVSFYSYNWALNESK
ncbi:MAG: DUF547 domain-containing protein [Maribacter sp.]